MPSYPHINVVGSVVTGSHGGGGTNQAMANYVIGLEIVNSEGKARVLKKGIDSDFEQYLHAFGALGIITRMQMSIVPSFNVLKCIYGHMSWQPWLDDPKKVDSLAEGKYQSYFTDYEREEWTSAWIGYDRHKHGAHEPSDYKKACKKTLNGAEVLYSTHPRPEENDDSSFVTSGMASWEQKMFLVKASAPITSDNTIQTEYFIKFSDFRDCMRDLYSDRHHF